MAGSVANWTQKLKKIIMCRVYRRFYIVQSMFTCSHLAVRKLIEMTQSLGTEIVIEHNLLKPQYIPVQVSGRPHTDDFFFLWHYFAANISAIGVNLIPLCYSR